MTLHAAKGLSSGPYSCPPEGHLPFPGARMRCFTRRPHGGAIDPDALAEEQRLFLCRPDPCAGCGFHQPCGAAYVSTARHWNLFAPSSSALPRLFGTPGPIRHAADRKLRR